MGPSTSRIAIEIESPSSTLTGALASRLHLDIARLSARPDLPDAPVFDPHVTLLGGINRSKDDVLEITRNLASQMRSFPIALDRVASGNIFHQCIYILCSCTPELVAAGAAARSVFAMDTPPYMPHLSLVYSEVGEAARAAIASEEQGRLFGDAEGRSATSKEILTEREFLADCIAVWYTPVEDKSLESWHAVAVFPLQQ
jgi:hypothetical protein